MAAPLSDPDEQHRRELRALAEVELEQQRADNAVLRDFNAGGQRGDVTGSVRDAMTRSAEREGPEPIWATLLKMAVVAVAIVAVLVGYKAVQRSLRGAVSPARQPAPTP